MAAVRILVLEDDKNLGMLLKEHLQMQDYEVTLRTNGEEGLKTYREDLFDLCLVDVMMPQMDGFNFVRQVRKKNQEIPIIFLTAKSLREDRIEGFKIGCDDYLTKPFSMEELLLRIKAVLRRSVGDAGRADTPVIYEIGEYTFDSKRQILESRRKKHRLTSKESELLRLLCLHMNRTLEREKALREIWGTTNYFSGRSMDVYISKLRKYLKDDRKVEIVSIHGKGFRLLVS